MKRLAGPLLRGFELGIRVHPTPEAVTGEVAGLGEVGEALHGSPLFTPPRRRKGADYDAVEGGDDRLLGLAWQAQAHR